MADAEPLRARLAALADALDAEAAEQVSQGQLHQNGLSGLMLLERAGTARKIAGRIRSALEEK